MQDGYHKHISSKKSWFDLKLGEVWRYRGLAWLFTKRTFKVSYKQTVLGPAWILLNPLITSLMHMLVFGTIAGLTTMGVPKFAFHLTSTAVWAFFSACVSGCSNAFISNAGLFSKVYFPRLIMPISTVLSSTIKFAVQMLLVIGTLCYFVPAGQVSPNWLAWLLIPVVLLVLGLMGMGFGIIVSSVTTKYRDLSILVGFGMQLWMYGSPVVYPLDQIGGVLRKIVSLNPMTAPMEVMRYAILGKGTILPESIISTLVFMLVFVVVGTVLFNHVEKTFIDTV